MDQAEVATLYALMREGLRARAQPEDANAGFPHAIEEEIAAGKQVRVHLSVNSEQRIDDPLLGGRTTSSRTRAQFVQQKEFTPTEKVTITLEGLELARVAPTYMAKYVFECIRTVSSQSNFLIGFSHGETSSARMISTNDVAEALPAAQMLSRVIDKIRADLVSEATPLTDGV